MSQLLEALAELERQMDAFPRVILNHRDFHTLREEVGTSGWDYETVYQSSGGWVYTLRLGHAETLRDQIKHRIGERVADALTGSTK